MVYSITNENLIVVHGGHSTPGAPEKIETRGGLKVKRGHLGPGQPGLGHRRHYPIFKDANGNEMISLNGQTLVKISNLNFRHTKRETVKR
jgi:hypothetical protein